MNELFKHAPSSSFGDRRFSVMTVVVTVLLVTAGAAIAAVRMTGHWTDRPELAVAMVACYEAPSLESNVAVGSYSEGSEPREICTNLWGYGPEETESAVACSMGGYPGAPLSVFPTSDPDTCANFGLDEMPEGQEGAALRFSRLREAIMMEVPPQGRCPNESASREIIGRALDEQGFGGWSVETGERRTGDFAPCALVGFDVERKVVILQPGQEMQDS